MSNKKALIELYALIQRLKRDRDAWKAHSNLPSPYDSVIMEILKTYNAIGGKKISNQQMAFFHSVIVPLFCDYTGDSKEYTEKWLKLKCGLKWFEPEIIEVDGVNIAVLPTKTKLSTKDFCEWYENITNFGLEIGVRVPAPDPEWRKHDDMP